MSQTEDTTADRVVAATDAPAEVQTTAVPEPEPVVTARAEPKPVVTARPEPEPVVTGAPRRAFANCTAARNAGAAPVYRGDPGYGSHLDRDDDGVGCES
ncbi:MAG: excalibur calcium-binding domain-containing protein [Actinobacteria bacterium]|nr:excalibur calcium-binding domain-containing protein [Actinomycetota bacterium]